MQPRQRAIVSSKYDEVNNLDFIINVIHRSRRRKVFSRGYHNNDKRSSLYQSAQLHGHGKEKLRILIVDNITLGLRGMLWISGFEYVDAFNDSPLALENFKPGLYDLVILDFVMPKMDRFALFNNFKEIDQGIKVCFTTTHEVDFEELGLIFPAANTIDDIGCVIQKLA